MQYGILYYPSHASPLQGTACALWVEYGIPWLTEDYALACRVPDHPYYRWLQQLDCEVATFTRVQQATIEVVEVFSGRRTIIGTQRPVFKPERPDYSQVMRHKNPMEQS